ncbi:ABC transporter [Micromonospora globispora]|uniref:Transport permease protein n=1 Tax=Micromonospora globispora TaxID=1450148 RepID=A0A317KMQ5_9ACTN|nr:ABC transporter permease [Micromonospora globispora]PWU53166.1 ABC transporter [Micromonospora globispora]PWU61923.1 ABC transporter [Micromonospora globispora]RQW90255.1 ABC transporter [Micromonospora globispora]
MVGLVLPRLVSFEGAPRRSASVAERNLAALKSAYWLVLISGFLEPVLYLFSIGIGVGALIGDLTLPGGQVVSYAAFVAPAMLASSAMTGALAETTFNFFGKMKYMKLYDGVIATPVQPFEIALGELGWAMIRGTLYSAAFLVVMVSMDLTSAGRAVTAFPAAVLVGFAFGALGMAFSTFMRSWQDFDLMGSAQFTLFLFSGTFVPAEAYPAVLRWVVEVTPLYRSVHLIRNISVGSSGWSWLLDVGYLLALTGVGLFVASRRMAGLLYK